MDTCPPSLGRPRGHQQGTRDGVSLAWALCAAWSRRETGRPGGRPPRRPCSPRGRAELRTGRRGGPAPGRQMIQTFMGRYLRTGTPQSDVIARKNKPALTENSFPVFSPPRSLLNGRFWQVPAAGNCQQGAASRDQSQQHGNGTRSVRGTGTPPTGTRVRLRPPPSAAPPPRAAGAWSWPPCRWLRAPRGSQPRARKMAGLAGGGQNWGSGCAGLPQGGASPLPPSWLRLPVLMSPRDRSPSVLGEGL